MGTDRMALNFGFGVAGPHPNARCNDTDGVGCILENFIEKENEPHKSTTRSRTRTPNALAILTSEPIEMSRFPRSTSPIKL